MAEVRIESAATVPSSGWPFCPTDDVRRAVDILGTAAYQDAMTAMYRKKARVEDACYSAHQERDNYLPLAPNAMAAGEEVAALQNAHNAGGHREYAEPSVEDEHNALRSVTQQRLDEHVALLEYADLVAKRAALSSENRLNLEPQQMISVLREFASSKTKSNGKTEARNLANELETSSYASVTRSLRQPRSAAKCRVDAVEGAELPFAPPRALPPAKSGANALSQFAASLRQGADTPRFSTAERASSLAAVLTGPTGHAPAKPSDAPAAYVDRAPARKDQVSGQHVVMRGRRPDGGAAPPAIVESQAGSNVMEHSRVSRVGRSGMPLAAASLSESMSSERFAALLR